MPTLDPATERLLRDLAPQALGAIVRRFGDFAASEDAVQEALIDAAAQWPRDGVPRNPRGWLITVAARRMTDRIRSESARRQREADTALAHDALVLHPHARSGYDADEGDDTLILLFMCCHPALSTSSAIALTLRAVGGLTTGEIAKAFLVPEPTMGQRISRAKQTIKSSGGRFALPEAAEREARLTAVLHVLYLIFSEGYTTSGGDALHRTDLSNEAIRLARLMHELLAGDDEVRGLLALMLLTDARRAARTGPQGELIPLDEQDRGRWDRGAIGEGRELLMASPGSAGAYQLQARIALIHDEAARVEDTDWPRILALYETLMRQSDNPMVTLSHAIATAMVHGPHAGLERLEALDEDERLKGSHRLAAVRAHLLEKAGDAAGALAQYRHAATLTTNVPERNYLLMKAARTVSPGPGSGAGPVTFARDP